MSNETTIHGHQVDWSEDENDPGRMGVWMDSNPIGSVWMTDTEKWMAEHWNGQTGFSSEESTFDDAVKSLVEWALIP